MQELLAQSSFDKLKEGAIVPGTITEIRQNEVVVDIGGKSEGVIPANEFIDIGELQIGSSIDVMVEKLEDKSGAPVLSYDKAEQKKNWDNILTKFPEGSVAAGRVKAKVKGGLIISIGVDAFMPASHIDIQPPKNLDQYVGQTYDFKVLKINLERRMSSSRAASSSSSSARRSAGRCSTASSRARSARAWSRTSPTSAPSSTSTGWTACCTSPICRGAASPTRARCSSRARRSR